MLLFHTYLNQTLEPKNNNHRQVEIKNTLFQLSICNYILYFNLLYMLQKWNINATYLVFFKNFMLYDLPFNAAGSLLLKHLSVTELKELGIFFLLFLSLLLSFYYFFYT